MTGGARVGRPAPAALVAAYFAAALAWLAATVAFVVAAPQLAAAGVATPEVLLAVHLVGLGFLPLAVTGAVLHVLPTLLRTDASRAAGGRPCRSSAPGRRSRTGSRTTTTAHLGRGDRRDRRVRRRRLGAPCARRPGPPRPHAAREPLRRPALDLPRGRRAHGWRGPRRPRLEAAPRHPARPRDRDPPEPGRARLADAPDRHGRQDAHADALARARGGAPPAAGRRARPDRGLWLLVAGLALGERAVMLAGAVLALGAIGVFAALTARIGRQHRLEASRGRSRTWSPACSSSSRRDSRDQMLFGLDTLPRA